MKKVYDFFYQLVSKNKDEGTNFVASRVPSFDQ